jgi:hypothetical protein
MKDGRVSTFVRHTIESGATYIREQAKVFGWHTLRLRLSPHLVIASLHQIALQLNGVFDVCIIFNTATLQACLFNQSF